MRNGRGWKASLWGTYNNAAGPFRHDAWTVRVEDSEGPTGTFIGTRDSGPGITRVTVRISLSPSTSDLEEVSGAGMSPDVTLEAFELAMWLRQELGLDQDDDGGCASAA